MLTRTDYLGVVVVNNTEVVTVLGIRRINNVGKINTPEVVTSIAVVGKCAVISRGELCKHINIKRVSYTLFKYNS